MALMNHQKITEPKNICSLLSDPLIVVVFLEL